MTGALQVVVPMAGRGSRFAEVGHVLPKPLIDVGGRPMIELVVANLRPAREHRFVFVVQRQHVREHGLDERLAELAPGCAVVALDGVTEGAACTVLTARDELDTAAPLMIANCDQWVDTRVDDYLTAGDALHADGFLMTMWSDSPKWSYAQLGADGWVRHVVEKQVVSEHATVGIYDWRAAGDFLRDADAMIAAGRRVNGEYYVAPVYNERIADGGRIGVLPVGGADAMHGLGTPEDLAQFLSGPALSRALAVC